MAKRKFPPHNTKAIVNNLKLVLKTGDSSKLNKPTYNFIILYMGFIAHYDLNGFRGVYEDTGWLAVRLLTGEMTRDPDYNAREADRQERDPWFAREYGQARVDSTVATIRGIVEAAREFLKEQEAS